jgi:hypothetical protein
MNWKEKAKSSFAERRTLSTLVDISVPAWGTKIYFWPDMNLAERREIFMLAKQKGDETVLDLEAMAVTLIVRARDKEGKRLFNKSERIELMTEYDPEVIAEVVSAMNSLNSSVQSIEDAEGN